MRKIFMALILLVGILSFSVSEAVQTKLVVRAKSKDAKFIGTKMGGALVVIRDSETGRGLAEGLTAGGTGDTGKIMIEPKSRFGSIADGAAKFEATIDIDEPTLITIDIAAPYIHKDNMIKSSTQMWLIPGRDIIGEGVILEIPGFSVDARAIEKEVKLVDDEAIITIQALIMMI